MGERLKHVLSSRQFDLNFLIKLFRDANSIVELLETRAGRELLTRVLPGYVVGEMFWQESSRTFHSFATSAARLGASVQSERGIARKKKKDGKTITVWELIFSSEMKDAYFEDEVRAWASFYDALILRTPETGLIERAADICDEFGYNVHFINAGDGKDGEHPTQTFLDCFSMIKELGLHLERDWSKLKDYSVAFINDLKNGRTIHSLARVCGLLGMKLIFIAAPGLEMPRDLLDELENKNYNFDVRNTLTHADVYYVGRVQTEYGNDNSSGFSINKRVADENEVKIVMHPFPRSKAGNELPIWKKNDPISKMLSLDKDSRAIYFKQMEYGMPVRMALLKYLLNPSLEFTKLKEERLIHGIRSQCAGCKRIEYHEVGWTEHAPSCGYIQTIAHVLCPKCQPPSGFHL